MPPLLPGPAFGKPRALAKYRSPVALGSVIAPVSITGDIGIVIGVRGFTSSSVAGPGASGRHVAAATPRRRGNR